MDADRDLTLHGVRADDLEAVVDLGVAREALEVGVLEELELVDLVLPVTQVVGHDLRDDAPLLDDGDAVAGRLDLAEDV